MNLQLNSVVIASDGLWTCIALNLISNYGLYESVSLIRVRIFMLFLVSCDCFQFWFTFYFYVNICIACWTRIEVFQNYLSLEQDHFRCFKLAACSFPRGFVIKASLEVVFSNIAGGY